MSPRDVRSTPPSPPPRREPSAIRFGPFEISAVLGTGAMATVYSGTHPTYGRVAIKVAMEPRFGGELQREHAILHRFEHPGIPRPLGYLEVVERPTLVMTHLSGKPLDKREAQAAPRKTLGLVISLLAVLDHVHRRGVVHCDLKPQNVLAGRQAQLLDFGIARDIGAPSADALGCVAGTPAYMAPEVLEGREVTASTDLYSLGVFIYRLLTGRHPFPTDQGLHLAAKQELSWLPPSFLNSRLPIGLDALIEAMLDPDPARRPRSGLIRTELRALLPELVDRPSPLQGRSADETGTTQRVGTELA